ncbi:SDR family NAD(P)-dependent oxidoreductase [Castellaniella caeni]|uniref:SDR family NAD(P)-dependent oxidoreductase n=1 Tax=Castellaniella caeni TaxID=266123 RepID=UPI00082A253D|nr:SDR family NAD(P)-dependent oxidoreductase [Castellaniella caeni]
MNQIALVTGAAQGLGLCIARHLHAAGFKVVVTDRQLAQAAEAARSIDATGERAWPLALDVTRKADFETALAAVLEHWGGLQVLVNNAAMTKATPVMDIGADEFDAVLAVNLRGTLFGCQVMGAHMAAQGYGRLVNMASLAGQNGGTATGAHYACSKGGIMTLTKIFARELGPQGVTCNAVSPGPMDLPSVHALVPDERLAQIVQGIPVRKLGNADFVADLIVRLAMPDADFVTGATWDVNGGLFMR